MPNVTENLSIPNFTLRNIEKESVLTADVAAGGAIIPLITVDGLAAADFIVTSPAGQIAEIQKIQSITGLNITPVSNYTMQHRKGERVVKVFGDKIILYKASDVNGLPPDDSSFSAVGSPVNLDPNQLYTTIVDSNGGLGFWYKFTYYNSVTAEETSLAQAEAIRGGGFGNYCTIDDIRDEGGIPEMKTIDIISLAAYREEAESDIDGALASAGYILPLQTTNGVSYTPALIRRIDKLLSAGYYLFKNFGTLKPGASKDGKSKIELADKKLAEIQLNDRVLVDSNKQPLAKTALVDGWPDDTTMDDGVNVGAIITMDKVF